MNTKAPTKMKARTFVLAVLVLAVAAGAGATASRLGARPPST